MTHTPSSDPFELVMVPVMSPSAARPGSVNQTSDPPTSTTHVNIPVRRFPIAAVPFSLS